MQESSRMYSAVFFLPRSIRLQTNRQGRISWFASTFILNCFSVNQQTLRQHMENKKKRICILGSANADFFVYVHHIPVPGQTIQANKQLVANGGKGANQAVAAARLLGHSLFLGQVGEDKQAARLHKQMTESGVEIGWTVKDNTVTGRALIFVDITGENSIVIIAGANAAYETVSVLPEAYKKGIEACDYLMLQKEIPMAINTLAAIYAKSLGKIVILDCGGSDDEIPVELIQNLDFLSPNSTELLRIDPTIDEKNMLEEIRTKLLVKYPKLTFILKMGSKGSRVINDKYDVYCNTITGLNKKVLGNYKIIDTVGAGDTFTSAFLVKHSQFTWDEKADWTNQYYDCLMYGNVSAFLCITKQGAMPSLPWKKDVEEFYKNYVDTLKKQQKVEAKVQPKAETP